MIDISSFGRYETTDNEGNTTKREGSEKGGKRQQRGKTRRRMNKRAKDNMTETIGKKGKRIPLTDREPINHDSWLCAKQSGEFNLENLIIPAKLMYIFLRQNTDIKADTLRTS